MRSRTLLTQVLAVNTVLVAVTAFVAAIIARERFTDAFSNQGLLWVGPAAFVLRWLPLLPAPPRALHRRLQQSGAAVARPRRLQRRAAQLAPAPPPPGADGPAGQDDERGR